MSDGDMGMNKNKFEIGTQWKTNLGHRAIIVNIDGDGDLLVWHDIEYCEGEMQFHDYDGYCRKTPEKDYSLIEPWKEPREFDVWIEIFEINGGIESRSSCRHKFPSQGFFSGKCVAHKKITIKEGEGIDD